MLYGVILGVALIPTAVVLHASFLSFLYFFWYFIFIGLPCIFSVYCGRPLWFMSRASTTSSKPSFRTPWRTVDAVVGRGNAKWTISKSRHPLPDQICSPRPPAEKTRKTSLLSRVPQRHNRSKDWTELNWFCFVKRCRCHTVTSKRGVLCDAKVASWQLAIGHKNCS